MMDITFSLALTPFWDAQTTFWASAALGDTTKLGYTYPDFNGLDLANTDTVLTTIGSLVNQLYGSSVFGSSAVVPPTSVGPAAGSVADTSKKPVNPMRHNPSPSAHQQHIGPGPGQVVGRPQGGHGHVTPISHMHNSPPPSAHQQHIGPGQVVGQPQGHGHGHVTPISHMHNPASPPAHQQQHVMSPQVVGQPQVPSHPIAHQQPLAPPNHGFWDWTARVEFKKHELGGSFCVLIFLGEVPQDPKQWHVSPYFVGAVHAFVNSVAGRCANCRNQADFVQEGFVHLDKGIVQHSGLGSLDPDVIEPYLAKALKWRVQKVFLISFLSKYILMLIIFISRTEMWLNSSPLKLLCSRLR